MSFEPRSSEDLLQLIDEYPLAWIVSTAESGFAATPLPLLAEPGPEGQVVSLLGHFGLSNPHVAQLRAAPRATVLFMGPQGYISPGLVSQSAWAPTWNYAFVQFDVDIEFRPQDNDLALERLVARMERDRDPPWTIARMGSRYSLLVPKIVAFRAHVRRSRGRFKLGQDETPATRTELLEKIDDAALVRWMTQFNTEPVKS